MAEAESLRNVLHGGKFVRAVGVHDGLTAILAQRAHYEALWAGGLGISSAHGLPDAGLLTMTEFHEEAVRIRQASTLPVIADVDSGFGDVNVVRRMVRLYEEANIDAVCIEDKQYPKRNSFRGGNVLEQPEAFARKIEVGKSAQCGDEFMVIARIESLIVGIGMDDALRRAEIYRKAGADALLIHSRAKTEAEVVEFCRRYRETDQRTPIFVVPTTYYSANWADLASAGLNGAIYANQVIRAAVRGITEMLDSLARHGSTEAKEADIARVSDLFELVGTDDLLDDEPWSDLDSVTATATRS
jgi:phosphoenolpyruvate phosphomutase